VIIGQWEVKKMDIAVLADIHGNYIALQKCVEYIKERGIETLYFLGDYIGELAYPQRTMELLYELRERFDCRFIRGNKEDYWLNAEMYGCNKWKDGDSTTGMMKYAFESLTDEDLDFFRELPIAQSIENQGLPEMVICHGSPVNVKQTMKPELEATYQVMEETQEPLILCGHTHRQGKIQHAGKTVLNPGAVGMPLESEGKSQFLILHGEDGQWQEEFVSLEYDVERVITDMEEAGLDKQAPFWNRVTKYVLRRGTVSQGMVLGKAMELCRQENGECNWPEIPEECWRRACEEMLVGE